ncbi:MAG: transglycosylase SLT domain-containing protein [Acidobacteriia bacterium]|nr:transglycosylase SLT domain-containing protein [Terriglobia bacterium]
MSEVPNVVSRTPQLPANATRSDLLIEKAQLHLQQGKKYYQIKDGERARREFDQAVDLMLEASENPSDRQAYDAKLEKMVEAVHGYDLSGLGSAATLQEPQFEKAPLEDILPMTFPVDPKLKAKVREQVQATVSQLPLTVNDAVLGYIHYFSGRGRNTLIAGLRREGRYRPLVQRILDEEGVPQELIHLAQAESGFLPRAMSRKAAGGMWQFVVWRGREYGLNQTRYTDDRLDPEKATRAAARHLRDLYQKFGDWHLAIAAYDCGPGVIERAVERTGYADFFEMRNRRVLPLETTNYVPIILAMTIMSKNAAEYGLDGIVADPPLEYDNVAMTSPTHLALISDITNTPVPEIQSLNPSLLRGLAPAGYSLHVPKGRGSYLMAALQMVPEERRASWRVHQVEDGETLATIGKRYRTAPGTIVAANHMLSASPAVGDQLLIPAAYHEAEPVRTAHTNSTKGHRAAGSKNHATSAHHRRTVASKTRVHRAAGFPAATGQVARASR